MERLDKVIDLYLRMDTNYAVMVTGQWGSGKTYYFKNSLSRTIANTPTKEDNSKNYRPLHISLFGIKSIEDIHTEILLALYPILKNSKVKLAASVGKAIIKGIAPTNGWIDISKIFSEGKISKNSLIQMNDLVICFDDIERLSKRLGIEEFIGFVNSLVENDNVKVIIIANDEAITDQNYAHIKEKVIGNVMEFIPKTTSVFDSMVTTKFGGEKAYKQYLEENKEFIIDTFKQENINNFRILGFVLNYFQLIYSEISTRLNETKILADQKETILKKLLKFTIAISIEYKHGRLSFHKRNGLEQAAMGWGNILKEFNVGANIGKTPPDYKDTFISKYYKGAGFDFFESIYSYITGGDSLNYDSLIRELKTSFHIADEIVLPQYEILGRLGYTQCFSLSEDEYRDLTKRMLKYSDSGAYDIKDYLTVFYYASRFDDPLKLELSKLEKRIIRGMKKGGIRYSYTPNLDFYMTISGSSENMDHLIKIREAALKINDRLNGGQRDKQSKELEGLCHSSFENFCKKVIRSKDDVYPFTPILSKFSVNKFFNLFIRSPNATRFLMNSFIKARYKQHYSTELSREIEFLTGVQRKVEKRKELAKSGMTGSLFKEFNWELKRAIEVLASATQSRTL